MLGSRKQLWLRNPCTLVFGKTANGKNHCALHDLNKPRRYLPCLHRTKPDKGLPNSHSLPHKCLAKLSCLPYCTRAKCPLIWFDQTWVKLLSCPELQPTFSLNQYLVPPRIGSPLGKTSPDLQSYHCRLHPFVFVPLPTSGSRVLSTSQESPLCLTLRGLESFQLEHLSGHASPFSPLAIKLQVVSPYLNPESWGGLFCFVFFDTSVACKAIFYLTNRSNFLSHCSGSRTITPASRAAAHWHNALAESRRNLHTAVVIFLETVN